MRIYTLQIHNGDNTMDELYHFANFENLCSEFENKFNFLENHTKEVVSKEYPHIHDIDGACGGFVFKNLDNSFTIGRVYDYDILDDDE